MWTTREPSRWGAMIEMTDTDRKSACTVRVTVKMRPDDYDELFRHVCEIGSTMSAFFRESVARAMKVKHPDMALSHTPSKCDA